MTYPTFTAVWRGQETSGSLLDSVGSLDATDNNSVGTGTGHVLAKARDYEAGDSSYHSIAEASAGSLHPNGDTLIYACAWLTPESLSGFPGILNIWGGFAVEQLFSFDISGNKPRVVVKNAAGGNVAATFGSNMNTSAHHFVEWYHDPVANTAGVCMTPSTESSRASDVTAAISGGLHATNAFDVRIGRLSSFNYDGLMSHLMVKVGGTMPTAEERDAVFNEGDGIDYPFPGAAGGVGRLVGAGLVNAGLVGGRLVR